jgi:hypothetical protein
VNALDNERQDRIDLLRGRLRRQEDEYHEARAVFFRSFGWIDEALSKKGYPDLTVAYFEREVRPTLAPRLGAANAALAAWLTTRDELAALEGQQR